MSEDLTCDTCKKTLSSSSALLAHKYTHLTHKPWACKLCDKSFSQKSKHEEHMNRHFELKPYACNECGKAFYQKDRLKTHIMSHRDERPFECSICRRSFRRRYELNKHCKIHDESQRMKMLKYVCEICGKRSYSKADNAKHMFKHSSIRQWECCFCDAAFKEKYTLRNHLLSQHEEPSHEHPVYGIYKSYFT